MPRNFELSEMEDLKIKFDGETHQIEANTLINSLLHFTTIVQEVNKDLKTNKKIEVKINALPEGSFLIHLTLEAAGFLQQARDIFAGPTASAIANIIEITGGIYLTYRFLKGKKPTSIEATENSTTITNESGDKLTIQNMAVNIYVNNKKVQESLAQEFQTLDNDPNVTGFELLDDKNNPIVQIPRNEFPALAASEDYKEDPTDNIVQKTVMLNIVRLSFDRNQKWEFYYEGNKISAKINDDDDFIKLIDAGEPFAKGDSLKAEIEIRQEFDKSVNTYVNKSYKINKIIEHIPRPKQSNLFNGPDDTK